MKKNVKVLLSMGLAACLSMGSVLMSFAEPLLYT